MASDQDMGITNQMGIVGKYVEAFWALGQENEGYRPMTELSTAYCWYPRGLGLRRELDDLYYAT
ncbi:hypothetical protein GJ744_009518 [Endocarpon pusillum]|uniref:Uncharacterized protein n=1 Tax=Endocarpon pusillum TaxID=364733 RepID=A0A8H7AJL4_9EURO|nr:hypothetical protein GJ744_009518 [Endocarpon pusillum]